MPERKHDNGLLYDSSLHNQQVLPDIMQIDQETAIRCELLVDFDEGMQGAIVTYKNGRAYHRQQDWDRWIKRCRMPSENTASTYLSRPVGNPFRNLNHSIKSHQCHTI